LESKPLVEIRADETVWEEANAHPPFRGIAHPWVPLPDVNRRLLAEMPDDPDLTWDYPDRSFDQLEYLLDPSGRLSVTSYEEREQTLPYQIVHGDKPFSWVAPSWRCSTNEFLSLALLFLDEFDPASARAGFSTAAMADRGIYKAFADADEDATFATLLAHLGELKQYYERVASSGLDVIVMTW
jgi:hypothetical protein